MKQCSIFRM